MNRLTAWEQRTEIPLTIIALVFTVGYAWPIIDPSIPSGVHLFCEIITHATWVVFVIDYVVRFRLADSKQPFVLRNLLDLLIILLPMLRPLRVLRLVMLLRILNKRATALLRGQIAIYVLISLTFLTLIGALAVLDAERGEPGSQINTFGDAMWWAAVTVGTVGYGDLTPKTFEGRCVAVGLMFFGIAIIGAVTASMATWLVGRFSSSEENLERHLRMEIESVRQDIASLRELILELRAGQPLIQDEWSEPTIQS